MLTLSKYFKQDIVDTNQTLKPIIVITDPKDEDRILYVLTQDQDELFDHNGETLSQSRLFQDVNNYYWQPNQYPNDSGKIINCISKVSNVKISNDYDSKTLKINRLRCTLYNYYDIKTKLSELLNTSIINKNLYLFYKSPTTNVINYGYVGDPPSSYYLTDYDCAWIYSGEISRIKFNKDTIDITAEDKTQIKIADKQVPYQSIDKLPVETRDRILDGYKDDNGTVPMTYGKVDRAYVLPYISQNNDRAMNVLLDTHPTTSFFKTAKIPSLFDNNPSENSYYLYVKQENDYVIYDHYAYTFNYQTLSYSRLQITATGWTGDLLQKIVPEVQPEYDNIHFRLWDIKGFYQRQVDSVYASAGSILDIPDLEVDSITNEEFSDIEQLNNNGGYEKRWYRAEDDFSSTNTYFDTGNYFYYAPSTAYSSGRWIILKLDKGISNVLANLYLANGWVGNTFMLSDYRISQSDNNSTYNDDFLTDYADGTGFFVAPISVKIWKELLPQITPTDNTRRRSILNTILLKTDDDIKTAEDAIDDEDFSDLDTLILPMGNEFRDAAIFLPRDEASVTDNKYWGSNGSSNIFNNTQNWININGLYYGAEGYGDEGGILSGEANEHESIAIFEFFPEGWNSAGNSFYQRLQMNNIGFLQSVKVENLLDQEIYTSIVGRKNHLFTEQVTNIDDYLIGLQPELAEIPFSYYLGGNNGILPDFDSILGAYHQVLNYTFLSAFGTVYGEGAGSANVTDDSEIDAFIAGGSNTMLSSFLGPNYHLDDSPFWITGSLFSEIIFQLHCLPLRLYQSDNVLERTILYNPADVHEDWASPNDYNHRQFFEEAWCKSIGKNIYEYIYQTDIDYDESWTFNLRFRSEPASDDYDSVPEGWEEQFFTTVSLDITQSVANYRDFSWDLSGQNIDTLEDWVSYFFVYMDDLAQAINHSIIDAINDLPDEVTFDLDNDGYNFNNFFVTQFPPQMTPFENYNQNNGSFVFGLGSMVGDEIDFDGVITNIVSTAQINYLAPEDEGEEEQPEGLITTGIIEKPSDIVMSILSNEMEFAKYYEEQTAGNSIIAPDYNKFDINSIELSRSVHSTWKMGFSLASKTNGKKLIEEILKESQSYPRFTGSGEFGLITIKNTYEYEDINKIINEKDVIKYVFSQTKREDIITKVKMFYRYDYGLKSYSHFVEKNINEILVSYDETGYDYYSVEPIDAHQDIELKYHTDTPTVKEFADYTLLNNCNTHNLADLSLPLNYIDLSVGDIIHIPLINNEKVFNVDYGNMSYRNGQYIYPLWIIMETNITTQGIQIKAYQLHHLSVEEPTFEFPDGIEEFEIVGNMEEFNTNGNDGNPYTFTNGEPIPNWNFNPLANVDSGVQIPFFDVNADGLINVTDMVALVNHILGSATLTVEQIYRMSKYKSDGSLEADPYELNVTDCVVMISIILHQNN